MSKRRAIVLMVAAMTLAITSLGSPAAAAEFKGTIGLVNGIPGLRVDLCINGKEIRSRTPYGGRAFRTLSAGHKVIKIYKADPRRCRGAKIAEKRFELAHNADVTFVVNNKRGKKFTMFDNQELGSVRPILPPPPVAYVAIRHGGILGAVNMFTLAEEATELAAHPVWHRGDSQTFSVSEFEGLLGLGVRASKPGKTWRFAQSPIAPIKIAYRYEFYLLGTNTKNAKFIVWARPIFVQPE